MKKYFEGFFNDIEFKFWIGSMLLIVLIIVGGCIITAFYRFTLITTLVSLFIIIAYLIGHFVLKDN